MHSWHLATEMNGRRAATISTAPCLLAGKTLLAPMPVQPKIKLVPGQRYASFDAAFVLALLWMARSLGLFVVVGKVYSRLQPIAPLFSSATLSKDLVAPFIFLSAAQPLEPYLTVLIFRGTGSLLAFFCHQIPTNDRPLKPATAQELP